MIFDHIDRLSRYALPFQAAVCAYLKDHDPAHIPTGRHDIEGEDLFVRVSDNVGKPAEELKFERHELYMDLQYVVRGIELMQTAPTDVLKPLTVYDQLGDCQFFSTQGMISDHVVAAGHFAVFFPKEAHRPSCLYQGHAGPVKKLVFKIRYKGPS
jgi:biofilm protein TabA